MAAWRKERSIGGNGQIFCDFLYYDLENNKSYEFTLPDANGKYILKFDDSTADMTSGIVNIPATEQNITHKICLIFSVSTLYLLVQPYPDDIHTWNDNRE